MEDTRNHGYKQPSEGSSNWHVPLNENFSRIDTGIEIRDTDSNRSQYEPKENSKFLATDTRNVYLGNGNEWKHLGKLSGGSGPGTTADGSLIAQPGKLQSTIDAATTDAEYANAPSQTVRLVSGETYNVPDTVRVKPNVRLECNGAKVVPTGDFNVFELYQGSELHAPFCDTRGRDWSSTQVVIGAKDAGKVGPANRAWVKDAYLMGDRGNGIGIQYRGGNKPCSMQYANGTINGFDKALDFYAAGDDTSGQGDWSNGNQFYGRIQNYRIGINMRSEGAEVSGNTINLQAQAIEGVAEWLWKMDRDPRSKRGDNNYMMTGNTVLVHPWDKRNYQQRNDYYQSEDRDPPIWFLGRGRRYGNSIVDLSGRLGNQYLVNNSDNPLRNGIFTAHGGFVAGTDQFKCDPAYKQNDSRKWHKESRNAGKN